MARNLNAILTHPSINEIQAVVLTECGSDLEVYGKYGKNCMSVPAIIEKARKGTISPKLTAVASFNGLGYQTLAPV